MITMVVYFGTYKVSRLTICLLLIELASTQNWWNFESYINPFKLPVFTPLPNQRFTHIPEVNQYVPMPNDVVVDIPRFVSAHVFCKMHTKGRDGKVYWFFYYDKLWPYLVKVATNKWSIDQCVSRNTICSTPNRWKKVQGLCVLMFILFEYSFPFLLT